MTYLTHDEIAERYPWALKQREQLEAKGYWVDGRIGLKFEMYPRPQIDLEALAEKLRADGMDVELTDEGLTATKSE